MILARHEPAARAQPAKRDSTINFSLPHQSSPDLLLAPEGDQEIPAQSDIASIRETGGKEAVSVTRRIWRD
jgi:hypothetical protein